MTSDGTSVAEADLEARGFIFFFRPLPVALLLVLATGLLFLPSAYSELAHLDWSILGLSFSEIKFKQVGVKQRFPIFFCSRTPKEKNITPVPPSKHQ